MIDYFLKCLVKKLEKENKIIDFNNAITIFRSIFNARFKDTRKNVFIDATCGNGEDTLFLAQLGFVYSFDIQAEAIERTKDKLTTENSVRLIFDSHEKIDYYIKEKIDGAIFNLGYLPRGNKKITTKAKSTIVALNKILKILNKNGIVLLIIYPGHQEGKKEEESLHSFLTALNQKEFITMSWKYLNRINNSPYPILIEKI